MIGEAGLILLAFVGGLVLMLATGAPVAVGMGLIGTAGIALFVSWPAVAQLANLAYAESSSFILVVVPLFVLMGEVLARSGIGETLFRAARVLLWRLPASSAVSTIGACTIFSSVCGSSPVTAATIGSFAVPEMVRQGYRRSLALGATAAGGNSTLHSANPFGCGDLLTGWTLDSYAPLPFLPPVAPGAFGKVYEIRTYALRPGGLPPMIAAWEAALPARAAISPCLVAMYTLDGAPRFTHVWPYASLDARAAVRAEAASRGIWPPAGGSAPLFPAMRSGIWMPTADSPLS